MKPFTVAGFMGLGAAPAGGGFPESSIVIQPKNQCFYCPRTTARLRSIATDGLTIQA